MRAPRISYRVCPRRQQQKGQAVLFTILLLGIIMTFSVYSFVKPRDPILADNSQTERALAQAKEALIGYAASNTTRPGRLPCPDRDGNGTADTPCTSLLSIGFLPWKTLGIPDLRDGSGAILLYAVSNVFGSTTGVLNSDTAGDFSVTGLESATEVIAIVFAAGSVVESQQRDSTVALCSTTGTSIARNLCPANYLEGGNEDGNASYVTGLPKANFNDRLLLIAKDNLFPAVLARVAREVRASLNTFYANNSRFPNAAAFSDATYTCNHAITQGRLAEVSAAGCPVLPAFPAAGSLPAWFSANNWRPLIFYAVSSLCSSAVSAASCVSTGGLTVSGVSTNTQSLLIITGRAFAGQLPRPCMVLTNCFEDAENINGNNLFQKPVPSTTNNDLLVIVAP